MLKNKQAGFSILEFMVVVAIILILAVVSIIALNGQKTKARDAKRVSDIRQIRTALEFYYSDEGEYPIVNEALVLGSQSAAKLCAKAEGGFVSADTECNPDSIFMAKVPGDPLTGQQFMYIGANNGYDIRFVTEKDSDLGPPGEYHAHSEAIDNIPGIR